MSARDFLLWIATAAPGGLITALGWLKEQAPDFAEAIDGLLLKIRDGLAPEHVADAVLALPQELQNILLLRIAPRKHPGDLA